MRTGVTMLGIIIGVGVVILVVAIGQGATKQVTDAVNSLGTNMLTILPGTARIRINASTTQGGDSSQTNRLTLEDAKMIAANFPKSVSAVAPQVRSSVQIRLGNNDSTTNLTGTTVDYLTVNNADVNKGRYFSDSEIDGSQKVCAVGTTVAATLPRSAKTD